MTAAESEVPMSMKKAYRRLERWRSRRTGRSRIAASIWTAADELAREHGVSRVAEVLGLEFNHLKRMAQSAGVGVSKRRAQTPAFVELIAPQAASGRPSVIEIEGERGKLRIELNGTADEIGFYQPGAVGDAGLIQITPQLRILVAIEPIDERNGIDSLAQLCREKLDADPFSGCLFIFRSRSAKAIRILAYGGQGFCLATKRLSKGRFRWWPTGQEAAKALRAHQAQTLLAAGDPEARAAPVWRRVSA